jgi:hypothetical protein
MKISKKNLNTLLAVAILTSFSYSSAFATTTDKNLAVNFSITDTLEAITKTFTGQSAGDVKSDADATVTPTFKKESIIQTRLATTTDSDSDDKTQCEHFDSILSNTLDLESASDNAKQKIDNVEETLNSETSLRDSILGSVKGLLGLQKKDKVIFREMRNDISSARSYYDKLDAQMSDNEKFLDENSCEDVKIATTTAKRDEDTQNLVDDEAVYRKQFAASLKEKMKILQDSVKEAKK